MKHIFLDTTCFFNDPFLENSKNNRLLVQLSKNKIINLYVSVVVIEELKRQLSIHFSLIDKELLIINKKYSITSFNHKTEFENILKRISDFFYDHTVFTIINFPNSNSILKNILNRNLYWKPPYKQNKDSMRDAIIWESYVNFSKRKKLNQDCVFITNNTKDFTKDLINEWMNLSHYETIWKIIPIILSENNLDSELYDLLLEIKIDNEIILDYKETILIPLITDKLNKFKQTIPLSHFDPEFRDGDINLIGNLDFGEIGKIEKYINQNSIYIQFNLKVFQTCIVFQYNHLFEDGLPLPDAIGGDYEIELEIIIIAKYESESKLSDFEIDSIDLIEIY